jgi:hypothetical protein
MHEIVKGLLEDIDNSGLAEYAFIWMLKLKLDAFTVSMETGGMKRCHYFVERNNIIFQMRELFKRMDSKTRAISSMIKGV